MTIPEPSFRTIQPHDLAREQIPPRVVDVRELAEFTGELGHLPRAELVPLSTLEAAAASWSREAPVLVVCKSGGRSAKAAATLVAMGFRHVLNLDGGTMAYGAAGLPVVGVNETRET